MQVTLPGRGGPAGGLFLQVLIPGTGPVAERLRVREIDDDEGRRLVRIIRRGSGPVVTWRRAQMVLLSAQGMDVPAIAKVAFTSEDRVRDVIRNFNADGLGSLYPKYKGGHPPTFTLGQRREIKKIAKSKPAEHDLPFSTWSLAKLADFLVGDEDRLRRDAVLYRLLLLARRDRQCSSGSPAEALSRCGLAADPGLSQPRGTQVLRSRLGGRMENRPGRGTSSGGAGHDHHAHGKMS